jgi:methyl coenzyme M reductase subunit C-like uncharacterized protein (methanogenesis marker protein 7)
MITPNKKELLFSVEDDGLYLHINNVVAIPFTDLEEWKEFAEQMLGMMAEMSEQIEQR